MSVVLLVELVVVVPLELVVVEPVLEVVVVVVPLKSKQPPL